MAEISIKKAIIINAGSKYATVVLQLVFTAILSRILTPKDYGVVAVVTVFTTFFTLLVDLGIGPAVIQYKSLTEAEINDIFSCTVYAGIGLAFVFCLFGFPIAWFYHNRVYISVCAILSMSLLFNAVNIVPNALLLREKKFMLVGVRLIVITGCSYALTVGLALLGFKYYALVLQSVTSAVLVFLWNFKNVRLRIMLKPNLEPVKKISRYSGYQFGFNVINYFARNLDNLIVGRAWGDAALGQYDKAYKFMLYPVHNLTGVISSALHPVLSDYQHDAQYIYRKYTQVVKILSLLGIFITVFCFWNSREIILLAFGDQWGEAAVCLKWLSLSIWAQMLASSAGAIYQSIGNTRLMFKSCTVHVTITVLCILLGISTGSLERFALLVSCGYIIKFFVECFFLITKGFNKSIFRFLYTFVPDIFVGVILFLGLLVFSSIMSEYSLMAAFALKFAFSVVLYLICLVLFRQIKYVKRLIAR